MSLLLNVCGAFLVSVQHFPDPTLQQIYKQEYGCNFTIQPTNSDEKLPLHRTRDVHLFFPTQNTWWPLYSLDHINSKSFDRMLENGIKPGVIIPSTVSWGYYKKLKSAVERGAIPILEYDLANPTHFSSEATLATAFGLRPVAAYVPEGWDPNLLTQPQGTYLIQHTRGVGQLPLPAREIKFNQLTLYVTTTKDHLIVGKQIILNPEENVPLHNIEAPQFGLSWQFNNINFKSDNQAIHTSIIGYGLIMVSFVFLPIDLILNTRYPNILSTLGSSISWVSLLLGIGLLLLLSISIIRKVRKNGTD